MRCIKSGCFMHLFKNHPIVQNGRGDFWRILCIAVYRSTLHIPFYCQKSNLSSICLQCCSDKVIDDHLLLSCVLVLADTSYACHVYVGDIPDQSRGYIPHFHPLSEVVLVRQHLGHICHRIDDWLIYSNSDVGCWIMVNSMDVYYLIVSTDINRTGITFVGFCTSVANLIQTTPYSLSRIKCVRIRQ